MGRCPACEEWDTLHEEIVGDTAGASITTAPQLLSDVLESSSARRTSGSGELDRVLGGGIVPGAVVLLTGEPGMGKSTLMLRVADLSHGPGASRRSDVLYIAGEESPAQIRMRADRLGVDGTRIRVYAESDVRRIESAVVATEPDLLIVDSIQSLHDPSIPSGPGSVIQTRSCAVVLQQLAKKHEVPIFLVGHVTKDGAVAGPKVLEHIVDTVIQFEGDRHNIFRILRAVKNRFGSCNEIGVFEMTAAGLAEVTSPSERFLACRRTDVSGSVVVCTVEGSRPVLLEMQALVAERAYGTPQRSSTGFDRSRLQMLLAVLERRAGIPIGDHDVFINAVAGSRVDEPAADAGVLAAVASAVTGVPVPPELIVVGEVGLAGELRAVGRMEHRLREAARLGFKKALVPSGSDTGEPVGLQAIPVDGVGELLRRVNDLQAA